MVGGSGGSGACHIPHIPEGRVSQLPQPAVGGWRVPRAGRPAALSVRRAAAAGPLRARACRRRRADAHHADHAEHAQQWRPQRARARAHDATPPG